LRAASGCPFNAKRWTARHSETPVSANTDKWSETASGSQSAQARLYRDHPEPTVGGRHHLYPNWRGLAVFSRRAGPVFPQSRGIGFCRFGIQSKSQPVIENQMERLN